MPRLIVSVDHYDIVASALAAYGGGPPATQETLVLLKRESDRYIIAQRRPGSTSALTGREFAFTSPDDQVRQYVAALTEMVTIATWS